MKLDEDMVNDRGDEFQTDDEENQAERVCDDDEDDSDSDASFPIRSHSSTNCIDTTSNTTWPQTFRQSVDMLTSVTPPSVSFLTKGTSLTRFSSSFLSSALTRHQSNDDSSPKKPLILVDSLYQDKMSIPTLSPEKSWVSSHSKRSSRDLPASEHQCSYAQTLLNGINVLCGMGLLTVPNAMSEGGWLSLLIVIIYGIICCYTGILLKRCLESIPGLHTYPDIAQAAFGMAGRLIISIALYMELYAACVEYIIMMGDNLESMFPDSHMTICGISLGPQQLFSILGTLIILPTVWFKDLSFLSYLSAGGVLSTILLSVCLLWVGAADVGFDHHGPMLNFPGLPFAMGIYGFCFSGHSVFPNIYSSMRDPSQFPSVLLGSFIFSTFMYAGVGICGFLMFGASVKSQFTLNMPKKFMVSKIAIWTSVVTPISKYALTIAPVAMSLEELMPPASRSSYSLSILIRTILVISTVIVALAVPFFGYLMALMGSVLSMLLSLIFPCALYMKLLNGKLTQFQTAACISIIAFGVMSSCIGTYSAVTKIAKNMS